MTGEATSIGIGLFGIILGAILAILATVYVVGGIVFHLLASV